MVKQRTALVVEDNALVAMDARETLEAYGFGPVLVFNSAEFAARLVPAGQLALALIATHLDGGDDTAPLAALLVARGVPFGFVSDFNNGQDIALEFRGRPYVTKPYSACNLVVLLAQLGLLDSPGRIAAAH